MLQSIPIQIIMYRNGLQHYQLIASMQDHEFRSSVHHPTIHHLSVIDPSLVVGSSVRPLIFLLEALRDTLGKLCMARCCAP